jgi:hypothetical protein
MIGHKEWIGECCSVVVVTFRKWGVRVAAACLEDPNIVREHKVVFVVNAPEERDATISVLHLNIWHCNSRLKPQPTKVRFKKQVDYNRWTYSSNKGGLRQGVIQDECELPTKVSHNLAGWDRAPVPQGPVGLYEDSHLICSLAQAIMLLQVGNVLNVPLEQAEDVIHSTKQPGQENKAQSQLNVIHSTVSTYKITEELSGSITIWEVCVLRCIFFLSKWSCLKEIPCKTSLRQFLPEIDFLSTNSMMLQIKQTYYYVVFYLERPTVLILLCIPQNWYE